MNNNKRRNLFFFLFALSGFSGLIYESIWTHYLKLFLGHAAYAQTLVLAIFMGGMAIGSWICSRYSGRWGNLLLGYAVTEGVIGVCAIIFHSAFASTIDYSYATLIPQLGEPGVVSAFKWTLSTLMILPQSILLGMTFPLMSAGILRLFPEKPGRSIALLYFANSIGAAIGVLASGFVLIKFTGLPGTIRIAGVINLLLAIVVWQLVTGSRQASAQAAAEEPSASGRIASGWYRWFLLVSLVTGTASFIYEIGWIRMLSLVLGTSTHAFELMLCAFILGLALGGLWIQRRIDVVAVPVRYLAVVQVVMGALALSTLLLYGNTFEVMRWIVASLPKTEIGYMLFNISSSALAMAVMLPATFCAGMTLPLITFVLIREGHGEKSIGAVYGANTVGAIIGVFFAIHVGMPFLGLKGLISFGAGLDILLGIGIYWSVADREHGKGKAAAVAATGIALVAGTLLFVHLDPYKMASGVYRSGTLFNRDNISLVYYRDGKTASVSLVRDRDGSLSINTNGKTDASIMMDLEHPPTSDESTMVLAAALPMAFNPTATTAATIGLGSGMTSNTLLMNPGLTEVDTVEIERRMVEGANNFRPMVEKVYSDPRSHIYIDDAKTYFSTYNKKYDLIISEPSNPWVSGVAGLFSDEFYRLIRRHLNENGIFTQWVQLYEINDDLVMSVLKAVRNNFSDYVIYAANDFDMIIVAKPEGRLPQMAHSLMDIPALHASMVRNQINGPQELEVRRIGDKRSLDPLVATYPCAANSDYYPFIDQNAAKSRFMRSSASELTIFTHVPLPVSKLLSPPEVPAKVTDVMPSIYSHSSQSAYTAMVLRDFFLMGEFSDRFGIVPESVRRDAVNVKELFQSCLGEQDSLQRMGSFFATAIRIIPFLAADELYAIWNSLERGPCYGHLPLQIKELVALLKCTGRKDGRGMYLNAKAMLENSANMTPSTVKYLLASGMLGGVAEGDRKASWQLWDSFKGAALAGEESDLLFRLLVAASGDQ